MNLYFSLYLFALISSFCISLAAFPVAKWVAHRFNVMDVPKIRSIHSSPIPRTGGIILFATLLLVSLLIWLFVPRVHIFIWHVFPIASIFVIGFVDDVFSLKFYVRLPLQLIFAAFFVFPSGMYIVSSGMFTLPAIIAIPFTIMCIAGVTNAYNIIDGLDGLCAGLGWIFLVLLACISYIYDYHALVIYALLFIGSILGFLVFNFPSAKIFLGDGGSYLVGFSVAMTAVVLLSKHPEISPWALLLMAFIPIYDTLFAISRRRRKKRSPFKADKRHLHHILQRRYRSTTKAVIVIWAIQILIGVVALLFHKNTLILIAVTFLSAAFLRRLWFKRITFGGISV